MREAWYVVEVYCLMYMAHTLISIVRHWPAYQPLALSFASLLFVFASAFFIFRGKRIACILFALHVAATICYSAFTVYKQSVLSSVQTVYYAVFYVYFLVGVVRLLRIKELPTRFTDPPEESSAHS